MLTRTILGFGRWMPLAIFIVDQDALGRAVEIVVLAAFQRPQESAERCRAKQQRDRNQEDEAAHAGALPAVAGTTLT